MSAVKRHLERDKATPGSYLDEKIDGLDLIVFDLDYTLWPFHVDCSDPPFKKSKDHIVDARNAKVKPYPHSTDILKKLKDLGYKVGFASRTGAIKDAIQLVTLFEWKQYIDYEEIYPGCKVTHFNEFRKQSGIPFERMLFFDDEQRNIVDINRIGAVAILVNRGISNNVVEKGIEYLSKYETNHNIGNLKF